MKNDFQTFRTHEVCVHPDEAHGEGVGDELELVVHGLAYDGVYL